MKIKNVVVAGGGVLGSQIAFQTAYSGFNVTIWVRSQESMSHTQPKLAKIKEEYIKAINLMATKDGKTLNNWSRGIAGYETFDKEKCLKMVDDAFKNIKLKIDMHDVFKDADLVIESLSEDYKIKTDFYQNVSPYLNENTIMATNSSSLLPSKLAKKYQRKDKFLAIHFANSIWRNNTAEIMKQKDTSDETFNAAIEFAKDIKMISLPVKKEHAGYLLNSMLIPFLFAGLDLYVNGISDIKSIDEAWVYGTNSPKGPFQILDVVGLKTAYNIVLMYTKIPFFLAPYNFKGMAKLLKDYIDNGKLGVATGEGFYKYNK